MSKCDFKIDLNGSATELISKAGQAIAKAKGSLDGNERHGAFSIPTPLGFIKGTYVVNDTQIMFAITDKPALLGCKRIEEEIRNYTER